MKNKCISTQMGKNVLFIPVNGHVIFRNINFLHVSKKGKAVPARIIKPPCSCGLKGSEKLLRSDRQEIFNLYWSEDMVTDTKQQFISCLEKHSTVHLRKRDPASNKPKQNTLQCCYVVKDTRTRVCNLMFLNTLSISNTVVLNVLKNIEPGGMVKSDQRVKQTPVNKTHFLLPKLLQSLH